MNVVKGFKIFENDFFKEWNELEKYNLIIEKFIY